MRMLIALLIVLAGGVTTVLLAIGARAGLDAAGVTVDQLPSSLIPMVCMLIVTYLFIVGNHRFTTAPINRPSGLVLAEPIVLFILCQFTLSIEVFERMGDAGKWPEQLSMGGLFSMAIIGAQAWVAQKALIAAGK